MVPTMSSKKETRRKVRVSKNKKKSWNKVCDVTQIEDYLEEKRFEERIGGAPADKPDEELFFVETSKQEPAVGKRCKKAFKCHQNIGVFSKVTPPINPDQIRYTKRIKNLLLRAEEKKSKRISTGLSKADRPPKKVKYSSLYTTEIRDLWTEDEQVENPDIVDLIYYRDEITKKRPPKVPSHRYQKPSLLPPVEVPHPGASYNPSYEDHQELVLEAVQIEQKKEKEELHLKRVLTDMFPSKSEAPTEESILEEMSQGLFDETTGTENTTEDILNTDLTSNPPVTAEDRVTRSRKRKRKELKRQAMLKSLEKLNRRRLNDFYRLRSIKSEIKAKEELSNEKEKRKAKWEIGKMYKPHTLSKHKYEPIDLEINLTEDLRGSLRVMKEEGNLLEDRYKSLQRRNLIESRIRQTRKRKYKLKVQVKRSHRDFK